MNNLELINEPRILHEPEVARITHSESAQATENGAVGIILTANDLSKIIAEDLITTATGS